MNGNARILVAVDDPGAIESLRLSFADARPEGRVEFIAGEEEALQAISKTDDFEAVFAHLQPATATAFLNEVWKVRPKVVRFLISESMSADAMLECVLSSHHLLPRPLTLDALKGALDRADAINKLVRNERIQSLVSRMRTLPSRPSLYLEIMRELRSPTASASAVGELVAKDLAISAKLMQAVNSAFYGLAQQVSDPAAAVLLLGLETTASLVLSIEAFARFDKVKPLYFSMDRVWRHSQGVAHSAKQIASLMSNDPDVERNAFTAGLLHDVGKLALALNFEEQYHGALKLAEKQGLAPCEVEKEVFGASHAEAGAYLLSLWGLPLPIVEAVAEHHAPASAFPPVFTAGTALHIAERLQFEADAIAAGNKVPDLDLSYAPELYLEGRMEEFRRIVRRDQNGSSTTRTEGSEGTMFFTREQLNAAPSTSEPKREAARPPAERGAESADAEAQSSSNEESEEEAGVTPIPHPGRRQMLGLAIAAVVVLCAGTILLSAGRGRNENAGEAVAEQTVQQNGKERLAKSGAAERLAANSGGASTAAVPAARTAPVKELKLQAILYNGVKSSLVINGRPFRLGDTVEGAVIVAIEPDQVTLEHNGQQSKLQLH